MVQKSSDHQLRLVFYPIIYKVLYIPGGWPDFWTTWDLLPKPVDDGIKSLPTSSRNRALRSNTKTVCDS